MVSILVVDDDRVARTLMTKVLETAAYNCFSAGSAEEALDVIEGNQITLLITDFKLPSMNGIELFEKARSMQTHMRGILCSAIVDYDLITEIVESGLDDVLLKPVNGEALLSSIGRSMSIHQHWRQRIAELRKAKIDHLNS